MEVLYFHQYFSTPEGASNLRSYEMAKALVRRGHNVTMVCASTSRAKTGLTGEFKAGRRTGTYDGINIIEYELPYSNHDGLLKRSVTFFRFALRSIKVALTRKYDLVFATSTPLTAGIPGIVASFVRRKPFVFEVRDLWPELPREMGVIKSPLVLKAMDVLEWVSYHSAKRCIGLSPGIVEGIKRRGISEKNITLIPNGCDFDIFTPSEGQRVKVDGIAEEDFVAIFAGAHGLANGLHAVLDAANELKKRQRSDIKILFVGDGKLKPALKQRAEKEGLNNCIFMDTVPKEKIAALQGAADVGLMILDNVPAFYYGTSPNKFFDYIATGLPVLNNYPGWLADMIHQNESGIAVPPSDPRKFADAFEYLADNPDELVKMGKNARLLAKREFDFKNLSRKFVEWLEDTYTGSLKKTSALTRDNVSINKYE